MSNGEVPEQSGQAAEGTAPECNLSTRPEDWLSNQEDADSLDLEWDYIDSDYWRPLIEDGSNTADPPLPQHENSLDQQDQNGSPSGEPAVEDPLRDNDPGETSPETFPIPSIIDMSWKPPGFKYVPYYMIEDERLDIAEREQGKPPRKTLPRLEENLWAQVSTNQSDSGESYSIPSIMNIDRDPCDEPYDPPGERLYTVLLTKLDRREAQDLRDQIRNQGLGAFSDPEWSFLRTVIGRVPRFRRNDEESTASSISRGNREGVDEAMLRERRRKKSEKRRNVMIVEQDGGELSIEELIPIGIQSRTNAVLKIFEMFEV